MRYLFGLVTALCLCGNSLAQSNTSSTATTSELSNNKSLSISLAINSLDEPYLNWDGDDVSYLPYINLRLGRFFIVGESLGFNLSHKENESSDVYLDLIGTFEFNGYEADDSTVFAGMEDRDDVAFNLGFSLGYVSNMGNLELAVTQDVANAHDGLIADVSYSKGWENASSRFGVYPYIGATYYGKDTVNYYYGVRDNEVTDTRAAYSVADGVVDPYAGVALYYALTDRWELEMDINHEWLDDDITDSPLVDADDSTTFGIAVTFKIY